MTQLHLSQIHRTQPLPGNFVEKSPLQLTHYIIVAEVLAAFVKIFPYLIVINYHPNLNLFNRNCYQVRFKLDY